MCRCGRQQSEQAVMRRRYLPIFRPGANICSEWTLSTGLNTLRAHSGFFSKGGSHVKRSGRLGLLGRGRENDAFCFVSSPPLDMTYCFVAYGRTWAGKCDPYLQLDTNIYRFVCLFRNCNIHLQIHTLFLSPTLWILCRSYLMMPTWIEIHNVHHFPFTFANSSATIMTPFAVNSQSQNSLIYNFWGFFLI